MSDDPISAMAALLPSKRILRPTSNDIPAQTGLERYQYLFPDRDGKKILGTLDNMRFLLKEHNVTCRYNVIAKRILHSIPGESFSIENEEEAAYACIFSFAKKYGMPVDGLMFYLTRIADENQYNPVMNWIESRPWDGTSRLPAFYATIESPEHEAKELLLRRWLITAVCMARGDGVDSAGCLVLQGPQNIGKTWWVKKLCGIDVRNEFVRTGASVDPRDRDSVAQLISYWIVELGEIGATFRKSDIDALKAFITRDHDIMRRPYGKGDRRYPRRTALIASVNEDIYLNDPTGNRRFWTIPCTAINSYHEIDMQQLWAEVLVEVRAGATWQMEADEKEHVARVNVSHMQPEPIIEMIERKYDLTNTYGEWKTSSEIAREIGINNVTQRETRLIATFLKKMAVLTRVVRGYTLYKMATISDSPPPPGHRMNYNDN